MNAVFRRLPTVARLSARLILGLVFVVFGLNGFLQFLPQPPLPAPALAFVGALGASGYLFPLLKVVEIGAGLLLLAGVFVPFALTLLAPVIVNIAAFHLFLDRSSFAVVGLVLAAEVYLAFVHRAAFAPLFARRAIAAGEAAEDAAGARAEAVARRAA
jgi:uncharacterized membrane protein YphA (DoxX/SURF4 family)